MPRIVLGEKPGDASHSGFSVFVSANLIQKGILISMKLSSINIAHVSDSHSTHPFLPKDAELIIHSGDWLPNVSRGNMEREIPFQKHWVKQYIPKIKRWLDDRPLIFSSGNHEFIDPVLILQEHGIEAYNINSTTFEYNGFVFYGFPFIPYIAGEWSGECTVPMMLNEVRTLKDAILNSNYVKNPIDVLVAHCPPYGVLDEGYGKESIGNRQMVDLFNYGFEESEKVILPRYYLTGHCHDSGGQVETISEWQDMIISNAATTVNYFSIKKTYSE